MASTRLTILICTHDRMELLRRVLASLNTARRPANSQIDILVVANSCSDQTHTLLDRYREQANAGDWLPLGWFAEPVPGKSLAMNSAIPRILGDIVTFVDDDHRVDDGYLSGIHQAVKAYPESDLFCGRILPDWDGTEPPWVHDTGPYRIYPLPVPRYDLGDAARELEDTRDPLPGGGNLFLRTAWLNKVGTFSTDFGPKGHNLGGAEDLEWIRRALALGARLRYAPGVVQYHYVDPERLRLGYLVRKAFERSASSVRLRQQVERVPLFTYRKAVTYLVQGLFSLSWPRTRFYLVRFAAALGEIKGYRQVVADQARRPD